MKVHRRSLRRSTRPLRIPAASLLLLLVANLLSLVTLGARAQTLQQQAQNDEAQHDVHGGLLDQLQASPPPPGGATTISSSIAVTTTSAPYSGDLSSGTTSTALPDSTSTASLVLASSTPYVLNDSVSVRSTISISNDSDAAAFFQLPLSEEAKQQPIHVAVSLCSGPNDGVRPDISRNASSSTRRSLLESSLARVYVSLVNSTSKPGPPPVGQGDDDDTVPTPGALAYAWGGFAQLSLNTGGTDNPESVWVGVWPPRFNWGVTGDFTVQIVVSAGVPTLNLENRYGVTLDDTDSTRALLTSFNYTVSSPDVPDNGIGQSVAPNISLVVLPTFGQYSLPSQYYNSSFCALQDAWSAFSSSAASPAINSSETTRGSTALFDVFNRRLQFEVAGLQPETNYTAWLVSVNSTAKAINTTISDDAAVIGGGNVTNSTNVPGISLYPAVKLKTKGTETCRLVYDVDFCPQVAYSIPIGPGVPTEEALNVINSTVSPNYANFSKT